MARSDNPPVADPPAVAATSRGARLPQRIYLPRTVGLALGSLCAGAGMAQADAPAWAWGVMLTYCVVWPHVAYPIARRAADPARAERRNVLLDSVGGGFWTIAMAFNVLPTVLLLAALAMNNLGVGGVQLFLRGLGAMLLGALAGLLTLGVEFQPATNFSTVLWCVPFLLVYPVVLGHVTYRLSIELSQRKAELRQEKLRADEASAAQARWLAELAARDELTGLYNRRYISEMLSRQRQLAERNGGGFVVALADLDHFKAINDTHGHAVGDSVLKAFAAICTGVLRGSDAVGRWGGEEFILVFPHESTAGVSLALERLRRKVAASPVEVPGGAPVAFTVSIGVTEHRAGEEVEQTLERADHAMYTAKRQGRDRVVVD